MKLLHIDSSIQSHNSVSRKLTRSVVEQWRQANQDVDVVYRDLAAQAPNHLSADVLSAASVEPAQRSPWQHDELAYGETLLGEFLSADVAVIGAPMYNFSIPSQLKAWLDRVMVAGRSFRYTETGPEGLARNKQAVIVSSRGGVYSQGSSAHVMDHQESYLKAALGFMGITDVDVIRAEGVSMTEQRARVIAEAQRKVHCLLNAP